MSKRLAAFVLVLLLLVVVLAAISCVPIVVPKPHVPPPTVPPASTAIQLNLSVYDEAGAPVTDATGLLDIDVDAAAGEQPQRLSASGWREEFKGSVPPIHYGWDATLTVTSPNYQPYTARVSVVNGEISPNAILKSARTYGGEHGWLSRVGTEFHQEDGSVWRYRATTAFQLLRQECEGRTAEVDAFIEDQASAGAQVFRVLGMFEPYIGTFTLARDDLPRYDACLMSLIHRLANGGHRIQLTVFADAQNVMPNLGQQQQFFAHIWRLVDGEWNVLGGLCNECSKNGIDPSGFIKPSGRVLWSRGSGTGGDDPSHNAWDFDDYHEARSDDYYRKDECRGYMRVPNPGAPNGLLGVPCLQEEPMGASETAQPGKRDGGPNVERAVNRFGWMGMLFALQGPGGLFHSDAGINGGIMGPTQRQMAVAFFRGLNFPPTDIYQRPYQRGDNCGDCDGIGGMPLQQLDQYELRAYCQGNGATEWCDVMPNAGYATLQRAPIARGGWHIAESIAPGLLRLTR